MAQKKKVNLTDELNSLAKVLSGEMKLEAEQAKLEKEKKRAIERQKDLRDKRIARGEEILEKDGPEGKKIVQNIKLYEWEAPIRNPIPFDPRTYFLLVGGCLVFIVYLAVLGHYALMVAILALLFFIYAAGTTEPITVSHKITAKGIDSLDKLYEWYMLDSFWFTKKDGQNMLIVPTRLRVPSRLIMLLSEKERAAVFVLLQDKLEYQEIKKQSRLEKMSFGEYIPLEKV